MRCGLEESLVLVKKGRVLYTVGMNERIRKEGGQLTLNPAPPSCFFSYVSSYVSSYFSSYFSLSPATPSAPPVYMRVLSSPVCTQVPSETLVVPTRPRVGHT